MFNSLILTLLFCFGLAAYSIELRHIEEAGYLGRTLTLDDGSVWTVKSSHQALLREWLEKKELDVFVIPNEGYIIKTKFPYCLVNEQSGEEIEVLLEQHPEGDRGFFLTIVDPSSSFIELVDWENRVMILHVSWWDRNSFSDWQAGDAVLIGRNSRWNQADIPLILINLRNEQVVRARIL